MLPKCKEDLNLWLSSKMMNIDYEFRIQQLAIAWVVTSPYVFLRWRNRPPP